MAKRRYKKNAKPSLAANEEFYRVQDTTMKRLIVDAMMEFAFRGNAKMMRIFAKVIERYSKIGFPDEHFKSITWVPEFNGFIIEHDSRYM